MRFVRGYSSVFWFLHRDGVRSPSLGAGALPEPAPAEPIPGREYDRSGPVTSHLDPRTRASVPPPCKDLVGGASTLEEARESYRAKLAALLGAGRHEMPSFNERLQTQR